MTLHRIFQIQVPYINYGKAYNTDYYPPLANEVGKVVIPKHFFCWGDSHSEHLPKHCYVHDSRLETIWRNVNKCLHLVIGPKIAIAPDYSVFMDDPLIQAIYQVWRSRVVSKLWQDNGVFVIPTIQWARPEINSHLFRGLSNCEVVAIRTATKGRRKEWERSCKQFLEYNDPKLILQFGTKQGLSVWEKREVINLNVGNRVWNFKPT
jgi:hypothetical protein